MRRELRLALVLLALLLAAPGVSRAQSCYQDPQGIGGTGRSGGDDQGIGGTGRSDEQGIGGTGISASLQPGQTALFLGTITSFGSVCVNGVRVQIDGTTPVSIDGAKASTAALHVGDWVQMRALQADAGLRASEILVQSAATGPVEFVSADGRSFKVAKRKVQLSPDVTAAPPVGESVRVFGVPRADGTIVASRVEPAPGAATTAARIDSLYGQPPAATEAQVVSVEGFATTRTQSAVEVGGFAVQLGRNEQIPADARVRVTGTVGADRAIAATRIEIESVRENRRTWIERSSNGAPFELQDRSSPDRSDPPDRSDRGNSGKGDPGDRGGREDSSGHGGGNSDRGDRSEHGGGGGHGGHGKD
jgi:uncharacterized protein DUF5666